MQKWWFNLQYGTDANKFSTFVSRAGENSNNVFPVGSGRDNSYSSQKFRADLLLLFARPRTVRKQMEMVPYCQQLQRLCR